MILYFPNYVTIYTYNYICQEIVLYEEKSRKTEQFVLQWVCVSFKEMKKPRKNERKWESDVQTNGTNLSSLSVCVCVLYECSEMLIWYVQQRIYDEQIENSNATKSKNQRI